LNVETNRTPGTNRARFLALTASAAGALAAPSIVLGATEPIRVGLVQSDVSGLAFFAQQQRFFAKAGVDAQIQSFTNGGSIIAAIASKALDVGFANLTSIAAARQRGVPIKIVAPACLYTSKAPVTVLAKARGSKLRTGADLRGKTIAVSTLRGELQVAAAEWIDKHGGDATKTAFLEIPFAAMAAALAAGRIDAAMVTEPAITLHKDSIEMLSDAYTAIAPEFLIGGYVASDDWLAANADSAKRYSAATIEAARWANTHHRETAPILAKWIKVDEAVIQAMTRATYGDRLTADLIQPVLDAAVKYGSLKEPMTAADLIG
jgi:NitT/TauT family transport system substrate-binding protein